MTHPLPTSAKRFMGLTPNKHFVQRCLERLPNTDPVILFQGVIWAIHNGRDDLVEKVADNPHEDREIYRARTPDGIVYLPVKLNDKFMLPATVLTHEMYASRRRQIKAIVPKKLRSPKAYSRRVKGRE
jgi:hypothetical protein